MVSFRSAVLLFSASILVAACGDGQGKTLTEPTEAPKMSLADIRHQVESGETRVGVAPEIDAAAKNINPFKSWDNYRSREVWDELLQEARERPDYLAHSMDVTTASFDTLPVEFPLMPYADLMRGAAAVQASAQLGVRTAHDAQKQATALIEHGIKVGTIRDLEKKTGETVHINAFKARISDFEKRNYLNYFLTVDAFKANETPEALNAMADAAIAKLPEGWDVVSDEDGAE